MPPTRSPSRRRFRRRTLRVLVDFHIDGVVHCEYATTLGAGGLFLESDTPLVAGSLLKLRFRLPHEPEMHEIEGRVAWVQDAGDPGRGTRPPGMGIEFLDAVATAALARALDRISD